jgi:hypothetical protein
MEIAMFKLIKKGEFTAVRLHRETTAVKLNEISYKRKSERNSVKSAQDIVEQLINQAHKREVK